MGTHRREFRFDRRYRALLGGTRRELERTVQQQFPFLPAGCHVQLDQKATEIVLRSLREAIPTRWPSKVEELRSLRQVHPDIDLAEFLDESRLELDDVYDGAKSWSDLQAAGAPVLPDGPHETELRRAVGRLLHIDDQERLAAYQRLFSRATAPTVDALPERERRLVRMLVAAITQRAITKDTGLQDALDLLWAHPQVRAELTQLLAVLDAQVDHLHAPLATHPDVPLQVHGRYSRIEILAAFGIGNGAKIASWQSGVYEAKHANTELFAFTLDKTSGSFSPTTRYRDYAISRTLIHWESQSITRADSPTGRRYRHHERDGRSIMLFTRLRAGDRAFWFLGPAATSATKAKSPCPSPGSSRTRSRGTCTPRSPPRWGDCCERVDVEVAGSRDLAEGLLVLTRVPPRSVLRRYGSPRRREHWEGLTMADHVAAKYTVKVHPKNKTKHEHWKLLGALNEQNAKLHVAVAGYLENLKLESEDGKKELVVTRVESDNATGEVWCEFVLGVKGQRVNIRRGANVAFKQKTNHSAEVPAAVLFVLPPDGNLGHMIVHVPYRRSGTSLVIEELTSKFKEDFPTLMLKITPSVDASVLQTAVTQNLVETLRLERLDKPSDAAAGNDNKWVANGAAAEVALTIKARKGFKLVSQRIKNYLDGDENELAGILEFEGVTFDRAKVQVSVEGDKNRSFNIEKPEAGHAITEDLDGLTIQDGWPTRASVKTALKHASQ